MEALPRRTLTEQRPEPPSECSSPARSQGENPGPGQVSTFLKGEFPQGHKAWGKGWASSGGLRADTGLCPLQRGNPTSSADKNEFSRSGPQTIMFQENWQDLPWFPLGVVHSFCGSRTGEATPQDVAGTMMLLLALCPAGQAVEALSWQRSWLQVAPCGPQPV